MVKPIRLKKLIKCLRKHDSKFDTYSDKGKGSHRMIYHPNIAGKAESFPVPCHGNNDEISRPYVKAIIRRFQLPEDVFD